VEDRLAMPVRPLSASARGSRFVFAAFAAGMVACSSTPVPEEPSASPEDTSYAPPRVDETPDAPTPMPEAPSQAQGGSDDGRELTPSDCNALAARYGHTVRSDEMAKLHPNLTAAQRDQARSAIDRAGEQLETGWRNGCMESLSGKVASERAVRCALAAKTVAAFDACLNSPAGSAP
jgi:hypothetical protein